MQTIVNGQPRELVENSSIASLLAEMKLSPQQVAVEVNLELVPRALHAEHILCEGDCLEIVTLAGGG